MPSPAEELVVLLREQDEHPITSLSKCSAEELTANNGHRDVYVAEEIKRLSLTS